MKTRVPINFPRLRRVIANTPYFSKAAFSLIEMIGVMAVMAILATVLMPNALKMIERTAVRAEAETLRNLGEQAKLYLRDNTIAPTATNWNTALATYASLSPADILANRRQMGRVYVVDPTAANQRALIVSSMRSGVATQTAAYIGANATRFSDVWNWNTSAVPLTVPGGWGAWNADNIEYLLIERISFAQIYRSDLASYSIVLNNLSPSTTVSFRVLNADGTTKLQGTMAPKPGPTWQQTISLGGKERLNLFSNGTYSTLSYTYIGPNGPKTFDFSDTQGWKTP